MVKILYNLLYNILSLNIQFLLPATHIEIDAKDLTTRYANDVIASCAFGMKVDSQTELDNQFYVMGKEASTFKFKQFFIFFAYSCFPRLVTVCSCIHQLTCLPCGESWFGSKHALLNYSNLCVYF